MPPPSSISTKFLPALAITTAIVLAGVVVYPVARDIQQSWSEVEPKDKPQIGINLLQTIASATGGSPR